MKPKTPKGIPKEKSEEDEMDDLFASGDDDAEAMANLKKA